MPLSVKFVQIFSIVMDTGMEGVPAFGTVMFASDSRGV